MIELDSPFTIAWFAHIRFAFGPVIGLVIAIAVSWVGNFGNITGTIRWGVVDAVRCPLTSDTAPPSTDLANETVTIDLARLLQAG